MRFCWQEGIGPFHYILIPRSSRLMCIPLPDSIQAFFFFYFLFWRLARRGDIYYTTTQSMHRAQRWGKTDGME